MKHRKRRTAALIVFAAIVVSVVAVVLYLRSRPLGPPVESASVTLLPNGDVLVAGGDYGRTFPDNDPTTSAVAVVYDPGKRSWVHTAAMPTPRENQVAILLRSGEVLVTGGISSYAANGALRSSVLYNPRSARWTPTGALHLGRQVRPDIGVGFQGVALPDGRALVIGGVGGYLPRSGATELYTPLTGHWSLTAGIRCGTAHRFEVPALLSLASGKVLALCDNYSNGILPLIYDPAQGRWQEGRSAAIALHGYTATLLSNGMVLVAGGSTDQYAKYPSRSALLYDPMRQHWSTTGRPLLARVHASAIRLADGRVLLAGGYHRQVNKGIGVSDTITTTCEIYDPVTGRWTATGSLPTGAGFTTLVLLRDGSVLGLSGTLSSPQRYDPRSQSWTAAQ